MILPPRTMNEEKLFLVRLKEEGVTESYVEAIQVAIKEKRPQLAGKIFALITEPIEMEGDLRKAQRALAFFLIHQKEEQWQEVEEHWDYYYQKGRQGQRLRERHKPRLDFGTRSWKRR